MYVLHIQYRVDAIVAFTRYILNFYILKIFEKFSQMCYLRHHWQQDTKMVYKQHGTTLYKNKCPSLAPAGQT